jgi:hypothetical protein
MPYVPRDLRSEGSHVVNGVKVGLSSSRQTAMVV